jgi:hypothetical protein
MHFILTVDASMLSMDPHDFQVSMEEALKQAAEEGTDEWQARMNNSSHGLSLESENK